MERSESASFRASRAALHDLSPAARSSAQGTDVPGYFPNLSGRRDLPVVFFPGRMADKLIETIRDASGDECEA